MEPKARRTLEIAGCAAGVITALLAIDRFPIPDRTLAWLTLGDLGHALLFGLIALAVLRILTFSGWADHRRPVLAFSVAFGVALLLGVISELAQAGAGNRDSDVGDVLRDGAGAAAFLGLVAARPPWMPNRDGARRTRWALRIVAVVLLVSVGIPAIDAAKAYRGRANALPSLCVFGAEWTHPFLGTPQVAIEITRNPDPGSPLPRAARLTFHPAPYPSFQLKEPYPDWTAYQHLRLEIFSPLEQSVDLALRIDDREHNGRFDDRFNQPLEIHPGANRFRIPLADVESAPQTREMDLTAIRALSVFAIAPTQKFTVFLVDLRLTGAKQRE